MNKVKITRLDKSLPLPTYETSGSVGFDLLAREEMTIAPGTIELIPGNVIVECPHGYMLAVASRSSTPRKKGLTMPHGFGIIDKDYCGPQDEIKIQVYNFTDQPVIIHKGDKIAQGLFVRVDTFEFEEVEQIKDSSRGGFGSTGGHQEKKPGGISQHAKESLEEATTK
ncbi:MAG: dUTP diphosphatase [bacterium]|nr:dUTP diphosphatase [bacterium]